MRHTFVEYFESGLNDWNYDGGCTLELGEKAIRWFIEQIKEKTTKPVPGEDLDESPNRIRTDQEQYDTFETLVAFCEQNEIQIPVYRRMIW